ncbi:DUF3300 domain-containing protein [Pseudomonas nitroreducens]|uniref:DUF3300 domain-containing protein n=1 Tax=Pseudomonas nitroreducens TaxID=46680 RepID=UPI002D80542B|nr:DUF3300 domain-containing protein [Pseudomonas nitroreducens]
MRECQYLVLVVLLALSGCDSDEPPKAKAANPSPPANTQPTAVPAPPPAQAAAPAQPATAPVPAPAEQQSQAVFTPEQLDQMLAPLALYPDSLLAQVLMATTYPGNVADAAAWSKANPKVSGDDAVKQVADQPWDPSVQSLVAFPLVLATLGQDPVWVQRVGDAFLAQPDAVMDAIQRLRRQAQAAGNLQSNEQQTVTVKPAPPAPAQPAPSGGTAVVQQSAPAQTIIIEPANPQVVYVPSYNPTQVYGTWAYPSSPPVYYPPPPEYPVATALATGLAFGAGVAIVGSLWGDCDWDDHEIDVDVEHYNNFNSNRNVNVNRDFNSNRTVNGNRTAWRHDPTYRNGVPYRDTRSREQYNRRLAGGEQREAMRGFDSAKAQERSRARESLAQRGVAPPANNQQARERAQAATRDLRDNPQALQRAQQANREPRDVNQARERAQNATRELKNNPEARQRAQNVAQNRNAQSQQRPRAQNNQKIREQARQQHARTQAPRNNAFAGANNPRQTRELANRGQVSRAAASRPQAARAGHAVQRPARAPRGGGRR